jgi:hypothetical protein
MTGAPSTGWATPARARPPMSRCNPVAATTSRPASRRESNVPAVTAAAAKSDNAALLPRPPCSNQDQPGDTDDEGQRGAPRQ